MRKEEEIQRMLAGKLFSPAGLGRDEWKRVHAAQKAFNDADDSTLRDDCQAMTALKKCFRSRVFLRAFLREHGFDNFG